MRRLALGTAIAAVFLAGAPAPVSVSAADPGPGQPWVLRSRTIDVSRADYAWLCADIPDGEARRHTFRWFDDVKLEAVQRHLSRTADGALAWSGQDEKIPEHRVTLAVSGVCEKGGKFGISGQAELREKVITIRSVPGHPDKAIVEELDPTLVPEPRHNDADTGRPPHDPDSPTPRSVQRRNDSTAPVIDVVAGYTPGALRKMGSQEAVEAQIAKAEAMMNQALDDSGVPGRVRIRDIFAVPYRGPEISSEVHGKLENPRDPELGAPAHRLREQYQADLVALFNGIPPGKSTGQGSLPMQGANASTDEYAYSVTDIESVSWWYNWGHELGHNLGLWHDRRTLRDQGAPDSMVPAGRTGWVTPNRRFHTLMAYSSACDPQECRAVNQYSNPGHTWYGQPLGSEQSNNVTELRRSVPIVAGYRTPRYAPRQYVLGLTAVPQSAGSVEADRQGPFDEGTQVTVAATAARGYRLTGWYLNGKPLNTDSPWLSVTMDGNHRLEARFARVPFWPFRSAARTS